MQCLGAEGMPGVPGFRGFRCLHGRVSGMPCIFGQAAHMPLPEPRMLGKAAPEAHASGKVPLTLLLLSARMASLGRAPFWPQAGGSVPLIWLPAIVSSLHSPSYAIKPSSGQPLTGSALSSVTLITGKAERPKLPQPFTVSREDWHDALSQDNVTSCACALQPKLIWNSSAALTLVSNAMNFRRTSVNVCSCRRGQ